MDLFNVAVERNPHLSSTEPPAPVGAHETSQRLRPATATLTKLRVWFRVGLGLAPSAAGEMEAHLKLLGCLFLLTSV